ncbi:MAG: HEPN domain-containing protein [Thaumarchaeota archaeon]|jgi:HEPN domain-containing protein|nr:HEPN domain-containing protein [Nitrososphaerota archaeon]
MRLAKLAEDYFKRARIRIKSAELAFSEESYPDVVRYSQECVELSLKAALRAVGVEYPKEHDMGRILRAVKERFPEWFRGEVERLSEVSRDLADKRAPSLYGIESLNKAPSDIFDRNDAEKALSDARYALSTVFKLLLELQVISEFK